MYYLKYWNGNRYVTIASLTEADHMAIWQDLSDAGYIDHRTHSWYEEA